MEKQDKNQEKKRRRRSSHLNYELQSYNNPGWKEEEVLTQLDKRVTSSVHLTSVNKCFYT
jgi:hypothetical protein